MTNTNRPRPLKVRKLATDKIDTSAAARAELLALAQEWQDSLTSGDFR
jgi:hypothetical protein